MPTLNWIGKEAVINHDKEVPFKLLKKVEKYSVGKSENLVVKGDNLEALKALMPYYKGKVKCIYIDPPYNTGNEGWIYNDNVKSEKIKKWLKKQVKIDDLSRHDKWLCMMYPRLKLLRELLREDGVIFVSIDDDESHYLKVLLDDIFSRENFISSIIWQKKFSPQNDSKYLSDMHDYIISFSKNKMLWKRNLLTRSESANLRYSNPDDDPRGPWTSGDLSVKTYSKEYDYPIKTPAGNIINPSKGRCWRTSKDNFQKLVEDNRIWFGKSGSNVPRIKRFISEVQQGTVPTTMWFYQEVGHNQEARQEIKKLFEDSPFIFDTPKPVRLIKRILQISTNNGDIILDSFAGSGTTGHAVMDLNKEDGGNRKFILVEMEDNIAKDVTAERLKRAIAKYDYKEGFEFCDLDKELFDEIGDINEECTFEQLATYIYFTENKSNIERRSIEGNFIGESADGRKEFYLIFKEKHKNRLGKSFLQKIKKNGKKKVIYADECSLGEEEMKEYNIEFKQIPYEVEKY